MWVRRADVDLRVEVRGEGPALLLQTGGAGAGSMWREYLPRLDGFQVVSIDHRGRGASSRPTDPAAHAMSKYVADVVAVADAVGTARFGFVGYSMGAQVGLAVAAAYPERVAALVALGGPWDREPDPTEPDELIALLGASGMPGLCELVESDESLRLPTWLREEFLATDPGQFAANLDAWRQWTAWPHLGSIRCPTQLVAGSDEDDERGNRDVAQQIPGARSDWLPGLGHVGAFLDVDRSCASWLPGLRDQLGVGVSPP